MPESSVDVLIVGAGATGLTLAIELARRGISLRLVEKLSTPFPGSRGKGLQPRSLELFDDLGVLDRVLACGGAYPPQRHYRDDGRHTDVALANGPAKTASEPYGHPMLVAQFATEAVLRERLAELGVMPEFGREVTAIAEDTTGVVASLVTTRGEEVVRARYLVGADGGRSFVRHALGIGFPGKTLGVRALVADVHLEGLGRDAWHRFNEGRMESQIAACPVVGTTLFQLQAPVPFGQEIDLSAAGLTALVAVRTGRDDIAITDVVWASVFEMSARLADRYREGRVFLAGDAAHVHPPTGGQGLNTSVQDAYNLGWKLASVLAGAPVDLLATYEEERRPIAAEVLGLSTRFLEAAKRGDAARGREAHQLDLGYPLSSLAWRLRDDGIGGGDRAPDAPLATASGNRTRLFDLFRGPHWTLLAYGVDRVQAASPRVGLRIHEIAPRGSAGELVDAAGHFGATYGVVTGDLVLVRPDGYVGAVVPPTHRKELATYLERMGLPASPSAAHSG